MLENDGAAFGTNKHGVVPAFESSSDVQHD
jgi:hypothetical protein